MTRECAVNVDLAEVFTDRNRKKFLHTLAWGDWVDVVEVTDRHVKIAAVGYEEKPDGSILPVATEAYITPAASAGLKPDQVVIPRSDSRVLKVNFVDVQQGDGSVIESPDGKVILVDGGNNQLFARYLAARFPGTGRENPKEIECILVTHGDADHFSGLTQIHDSEKHPEKKKRLFIAPKRVYHNGLVKRPEKDAQGNAIPDAESLGPTKVVDGETIVTGLADSLLDVPDQEMNRPFREWKKALDDWNGRSPIDIRRVACGDGEAFDFFAGGGMKLEVLGPVVTTKNGVTGLTFFHTPPKPGGVGRRVPDTEADPSRNLSASHTINGHSVVFRLRYGDFSYLFTGDMNEESSLILARKQQSGEVVLRSEVFKVPHHGSADFSGEFLQMVSPLVSVISSGDESARNDYIHPRANLVGALGKHSRVDEPLIFVTELVAFFNEEGWSRLTDKRKEEKRGSFYAFSRTAYGIVKTRTDGKRLLVYTDSGKADLKEAYCYSMDGNGNPVPSPVRKA